MSWQGGVCAGLALERDNTVMQHAGTKERSLRVIATDFFAYLGTHLPQQCASDEFYFLPRAENAREHLNSLDDLTPERIQDHVRYVRDLLREVSQRRGEDLEQEVDRHLVRQSMKRFIREFYEAEVWRNDPTLYVKIPVFATDQVVLQGEGGREGLRPRLLALFSRTPSFLAGAIANLGSPSDVSLQVALEMTQDVLEFYRNDIQNLIAEKMGDDKELGAEHRRALKAWAGYRSRLRELPARNSFPIGEEALDDIIAVSLCYPRSCKEILKMAQHAYQETRERFRALARDIERGTARSGAAHKGLPSVASAAGLLQLYREEVEALRRFFVARDIITFPSGEALTVRETPRYLRALRATASYKAPLTGNVKDRGTFYLTPGAEDLGLIARHCPYLSAHETYPGHHILDYLRIHHKNPIRRQIESPLFYEGWACYAETLLDELGYIQDPCQQLVQLTRQMWRCLRAVLDVELQTGKVGLDHGAEKLRALGFSPERAQRQIRRFCLSPGYQLCYFVGMYEIMRLREKFGPRMGLKRFHDTLLGGGEIPFSLVEKRLEAALHREA